MSQVRFLEVSPEYAGQRLDNFLQRELKGVPRTRIYRALRKGEIRVNKGRVKPTTRLQAGDSVRIPPLQMNTATEVTHVPDHWSRVLPERIVYEDAGLLVLNKPSGLAVHGGSGLNYGLIECLRLLRPDDHYLELVHRLDRETSGLLMIARKASVLKDLHRQLREEHIDKRYLALVAGNWPRRRSFVEAPLLKNTLKSGERMVRVDRQGKAARTNFKVLRRLPGASLLEAAPLTGRTHQIRVHAQFAGHPLLGDSKYQDDATEAVARKLLVPRLFLHAAQLTFKTLEGQRQTVKAPLDADLQAVVDKLVKEDERRADHF